MGAEVLADETRDSLQAQPSSHTSKEFSFIFHSNPLIFLCPQFNFDDHTKVILSSAGQLITLIDENATLTRWTLRDLMAWSIRHGASRASSSEAKTMNRLLEKLEYCKEVLVSIRSASTGLPAEAVTTNPSTGSSKTASS
jgi:hypothetical protein